MRPECCAGVFSIRSRPPIPPPPRPESLRPESPRKRRSGAFCGKRGTRAIRVGKTGQPSVFPACSPEMVCGKPGKRTRIIILLCGLSRRNRQDAADRRCPEKRGGARRCPQRRSAAAGRPGNFLQNEERSFQIRETGQPSGFQSYFPESEIERPCKNAGWLSGRVPVRLGGAGQNPVFPVIPAGAPGLVPGPLLPLERGQDIYCGMRPFRRGILKGRGSGSAANASRFRVSRPAGRPSGRDRGYPGTPSAPCGVCPD